MLLCSLAACLGGPDPRTHSLEGTKGRRRQQRCRKVKCSQSHRNGLHISAIHATRLLKSRERAHQVLSKFQHLSLSTYLDVRSLFDLPYILYTQSHGAWDALQSWLRMYEVQSVSVPRYAYRTLCICMHLFRRGITMSSCSNLVAKVCVHDRRSLSLSLSAGVKRLNLLHFLLWRTVFLPSPTSPCLGEHSVNKQRHAADVVFSQQFLRTAYSTSLTVDWGYTWRDEDSFVPISVKLECCRQERRVLKL